MLIVTEEWAPYNYTENGKITGVSTEIVRNILKLLGKSYSIDILPSERSMIILNSRPSTIMFSMFRTPEREDQYQWIGPLIDSSVYFYKRKDTDIAIETLDDLRKDSLSICVRQAGLVHDLLMEQGFDNLDTLATNGLEVYRKLLAGRCDFAISESDLGVRHILNTIDLKLDDVFEKTPFSLFKANLYIVASKDIPDEDIQQWQSALDTLKANGVYEEVIQEYIHSH